MLLVEHTHRDDQSHEDSNLIRDRKDPLSATSPLGSDPSGLWMRSTNNIRVGYDHSYMIIAGNLSRYDAPALKRPVTYSLSLETTCTPFGPRTRRDAPVLAGATIILFYSVV